MKIKLLVFFLLFSFFATANNAEIRNFCNNKIDQSFVENIHNFKIKNINIEINNYRKWTKNSLNILIGNFRWVPKRLKKRFKANVIVQFDNNLICTYKARIRHNGDQKDHIAIKENSIIQSIDVHLDYGNIYGITKFKLLRPNTRGNFKDEIILTELLREFNFLAPRTVLVNAKINEVESKMIFQEKATKELLEFNNRREGPILEGDERFMFRLAENIPDNQLSNESMGMMPLLEKGINAMLGKQTNSSWINKGHMHSTISLDALSNLNLIYLLYSNKYKDNVNNYFYSNYTLDNNLLALKNSNNLLKLDTYNLLIFATNAWHGLVPNNRKFYWNAIENFFEPINYDSNTYIKNGISSFHLPFSQQIELAFGSLEKLLNTINVVNFNKKINLRGIKLTEEETKDKISIIKNNLQKLKSMYLETDPEVLEYNRNNKINKEMWDKYYQALYEIDPSIYLVKHLPENNLFQRCVNKTPKCINYIFNKNQLTDLVEGKLSKNKREYQYLGKNVDSNILLINSDYKRINFQDGYFYFDKNINYEHDKEKKEFNIFQTKMGSRAFFYKGILKDININFYGVKNEIDKMPKNYPFDKRGLTACLSLVNLSVENINIKSSNSSCEDSVNLINVEGNIKNIDIDNSFSDGLDVDFSNVDINHINIFQSGNDCVDFSSGIYKLSKLNLGNCGDKALSVGEGSFLTSDEIMVKNSDIGIASKDSSITKVNNVYLTNLQTCVSAYNKKQEFHGGFLEIQNLICKNYNKKTDADINSKINILGEIE